LKKYFFLVCSYASLFSVPINTLIVAKTGSSVEGHEGVVSDLLSAKSKKRLQEFIGKEISQKTLHLIKEMALACINEQGDYAVKAFYPKQDVSAGNIFLSISVPTVETFEIKGNRWEKDAFYENRLAPKKNESFQSSQILNEVAWLNRNPFRYAEVVVSPGEMDDTVDVDLLIKDRFSFRPFAGADNTGTDLTHRTRLFAGYTWGKPFGRDDVMTYQYRASPDLNQFSSHNGSYQIFLPWKHELMMSGGYSVTQPDVEDFFHEAISVQASLRYAIPFYPLFAETKQAVTLGVDYKNLNSNVFYIEKSPANVVSSHQVNLSQLYFGYLWKRKFVANIELFISPAQILPNQSEKKYSQLRPQSSVLYGYGKILLNDSYGKADFFSWTLRAQCATGPLLPSEQFGLGGIGTVRGYTERRFNADNAICINAEIAPLKMSIFKQDRLILLAFSDFGFGFNYQVQDLAQKSQYLWSVGFGAKYQFSTFISLNADYGVQLRHLYQDIDLGRFHVNMAVSY